MKKKILNEVLQTERKWRPRGTGHFRDEESVEGCSSDSTQQTIFVSSLRRLIVKRNRGGYINIDKADFRTRKITGMSKDIP